MASDIFLKMDHLKGESVVKGFENQIQLSGWTWGASQKGTLHTATGGGASKVSVRDINCSHKLDAASPSLMLACCKGQHFDEATLTMRKAGGEPLPYLTIKLKGVIITSIETEGSANDELPVEHFSIHFASFDISYQPQSATGAKKGGAISIAYDIARMA